MTKECKPKDAFILSYLQLEIWGNVQVWRQAATQVFFALGLGYGSVIAYSSYNPVHNNCHRDALMVSCINFMTSVLASLVVFIVLGFRAKNIALRCVAEYVCLCMIEMVIQIQLASTFRLANCCNNLKVDCLFDWLS